MTQKLMEKCNMILGYLAMCTTSFHLTSIDRAMERYHGGLRTRRSLAAHLLGLFVILFTAPAFAQDSSGLDDAEPSSAREVDQRVFQALRESRASKLDIGLLRLQHMMGSVLAANRPAIFRRDNFKYFDVTFEPSVSIIAVGLAYKSTAQRTDDLVSECQDNINIALAAAMFTDVPRLAANTEEQRRALSCKVDSMFVNRSVLDALKLKMANPGWSVCDSILLTFAVNSLPMTRSM